VFSVGVTVLRVVVGSVASSREATSFAVFSTWGGGTSSVDFVASVDSNTSVLLPY